MTSCDGCSLCVHTTDIHITKYLRIFNRSFIVNIIVVTVVCPGDDVERVSRVVVLDIHTESGYKLSSVGFTFQVTISSENIPTRTSGGDRGGRDRKQKVPRDLPDTNIVIQQDTVSLDVLLRSHHYLPELRTLSSDHSL